MLKCTICKNRLSDKAKECPFCGAQIPRVNYVRIVSITIIAIVTLIILYQWQWHDEIKQYPLAKPIGEAAKDLSEEELDHMIDSENFFLTTEQKASQHFAIFTNTLPTLMKSPTENAYFKVDLQVAMHEVSEAIDQLQALDVSKTTNPAFLYLVEKIKDDLEKSLTAREEAMELAQTYLRDPSDELLDQYQKKIREADKYRALFFLNMVKLKISLNIAKTEANTQ